MTYVEINLDNLKHNFNLILDKGYAPQEIFAVVKDDAYGCGAIAIAQTLETLGVVKFAVARMSEASELLDARIRGDILVLGENSHKDFEYASSNNVHVSINSIESLRNIISTSLDLTVHINVDTGMGRLGISENEIAECCRIIKQHENIKVEAIYSHFSCADSIDQKLVEVQLDRFNRAKKIFKENGIEVKYFHFPNSAGVLNIDKMDNTYSRVGIALYGCKPDPKIKLTADLKNIMSLKTTVAMVKRIRPGDTVSYGANFVAEKETVIATVPAGYAHGIPRILTGNMDVLIKGERFPVVGNITMDFIMVDVGINSGIDIGEEVVILGAKGNQNITADEWAIKSNTIGYEILCSLGRNKEKRYIGK